MVYAIVGLVVFLGLVIKFYQYKNNKLQAANDLSKANIANAASEAEAKASKEKLDEIDNKIKETTLKQTNADFFNDRYGKGDK